jgi:E1A/CREB-binding protein
VLQQVRKLHEAGPFLEPVDHVELKIPEYPTIVKRPMDLQTMGNKLAQDVYKDPWQFCDDFRLMIDNAWLFNKKTSKIYKMTTQLNDAFDEIIQAPMKRLGYCCGRRLFYTPQVRKCTEGGKKEGGGGRKGE